MLPLAKSKRAKTLAVARENAHRQSDMRSNPFHSSKNWRDRSCMLSWWIARPKIWGREGRVELVGVSVYILLSETKHHRDQRPSYIEALLLSKGRVCRLPTLPVNAIDILYTKVMMRGDICTISSRTVSKGTVWISPDLDLGFSWPLALVSPISQAQILERDFECEVARDRSRLGRVSRRWFQTFIGRFRVTRIFEFSLKMMENRMGRFRHICTG
jgi:hypothetical protein